MTKPYIDPTTGQWVGERETRGADGEVTRETEWFDTEAEARQFSRTAGPVTDATPTTTVTKPEDLHPFKVDTEAFWQIERMTGGDGYDVMDKAAEYRWVPVSGWGRDGWDFLEWPYYVGYVRNTSDGFEFATNCEGDVDVWRFPSKELREQAMDLWAFLDWDRKSRDWVHGVTADAIPDHLRGPYDPARHESGPYQATSDADILREVGMDEAAEDLDRELGGNF